MIDEEAKQLTTELVDRHLTPGVQLRGEPVGRNLYLRAIQLMNAGAKNSFAELAGRARAGDETADGALCLAAARGVSAGENLEGPLADYITEILCERGAKYKRAPKADKNVSRDLCILATLLELETRHQADPKPSD